MSLSTTDPLCITAYGAVTPLGDDLDEIATNLFNHVSGITPIRKFDTHRLSTYFAGVPEIGNAQIRWPLEKPFKNGEVFYTDIALKRLLDNSDIAEHYRPEEISCILGVDKPAFNIDTYLRYCDEVSQDAEETIGRARKCEAVRDCFQARELDYVDTTSVLDAVNRQIRIGATSLCHLGLCSASGYSMIMAARDIHCGKSKAVITGGVSAKVSPFNVARLENMGVTIKNAVFTPAQMCRPFDKHRQGFVLSEGAVFFVMERLSEAEQRGVKPLVILSGFGASLGAQHIVAPHTEEVEMLTCMRKALKDAALAPEEIDLINAHATSTQQNDLHEANAIDTIFGDARPIVSATKSQHGHLIAATAAMETLCIIISMQQSRVPRILNLDEIDFNLPRRLNLATQNINKPIRYALKNSFGMGGLAASLIFKNPGI